jgi:predicted esterase
VSGGVVPPSNVPLAALKPFMPAEMFALYSSPAPYSCLCQSSRQNTCLDFHGGQDGSVDIKESRKMESALKAAGGTAKYTEYAEEKHFIMDKVFTDTEFLKWLMSQKLAP